MAGIYPSSGVGPGTGNAANSVSVTVAGGCTELFYSTTVCTARFDPSAANAVISEILNAVAAGGGVYQCTQLANLASYIGSIPPATAAIGSEIPVGSFYRSTDGDLFFNGTGAVVTVVDPTTTGLAAQSLTEITGNPVAGAVAVGDSIGNGEIVCASDGALFVNKSGGVLTVVDASSNGLTTLGLLELSGAESAVPATDGDIIRSGRLVCSSDGVVYINKSGANQTVPTDTTAVGLAAAGFSPVSSSAIPTAAATVPIPTQTFVNSTDGGLFFNATGATYVPGGTTTADLITAGLSQIPLGVTDQEPELDTLTDLQARADFPGSGFVGDFPATIRPEAYIDDTVTPGVLMRLDPASGIYYPPNGLTQTFLGGISAAASGGTFPNAANGLPFSYINDITGLLRYWDGVSAYVDLAPATPPAVFPNQVVFNNTGADQVFPIPATATWVRVQAWGAGGGAANQPYLQGGVGGYTEAIFMASAIVTGSLTVVVGSPGFDIFNGTGNLPNSPPVYGGGGGGAGGTLSSAGSTSSGGGLSGVFDGAFAQANAVAVAGGGGGHGHGQFTGQGTSGTNGNNPLSGGNGAINGITPTAVANQTAGGGGGGYEGGGQQTRGTNGVAQGGEGGSGFVFTSAFSSSVQFTADNGGNVVPASGDANYVAGIGSYNAALNTVSGAGLVVIEFD